MSHSAIVNGWRMIGEPIESEGWLRVLAFVVIAPLIGLLMANMLMIAASGLEKRSRRSPSASFYRYAQLTSSALLSLMHGSNDAQKTAGIIAGALLASGANSTFTIPLWVLAASFGTMGVGTLCGGWRIVKTMGTRLTKLTPLGGVCAETASALSICAATIFELPISTTHVTTGAILGVGVAHNPHGVGWRVGRRIAWAWILTIPCAALMGFCVMAFVARGG